MLNFKTNIINVFLLVFLFGSMLPFFLEKPSNTNLSIKNEVYNSELSGINTLERAVFFIDEMYDSKYHDKFDTVLYVNVVSDFVKQRFYHGLAEYSINDNWIAALMGNLIWSHFSAIVDPNDILNHSEALCSQQAIVFMEILTIKGIENRSVGIGSKEGKGHFMTEVFYNNSWHLYDVNKEPRWDNIVLAHQSMSFYNNNKDSLYKIYQGKLTPSQVNQLTEKLQYGKPNEFSAKKMLLFHLISKIITYFLPIFFTIMFIIKLFKQFKKTQ